MFLDTHVVLWLVTDSERLGASARAQIRSSPRVSVSAICITELIVKSMRGELQVPDDLPGQLSAQGLVLEPFSATHAEAMLEFDDLADHDPFDRMLLGQARSERRQFLTADQRLLSLDHGWIADARS